VQALQAIDFDVSNGEFVCLLGPSGCGKSTLLNIIAKLTPSDSGSVTVHGDPGDNPVVSYMFQESRLLPWMTVEDNLHFVLDAGRTERRRRVDEWLGRVGLRDFADYYPR
jgi:ABC-type nitrate/sulfonate/bicarbonate transport system ATPase subunit